MRMTSRPWLGLVALAACTSPPRAIPPAARAAAPAPPAAPPRSWRPIATPAPFSASMPQLLSDGTVLMQDLSSEAMWRLTPDEYGSYEHGTWSRRGSLPAGYSPLYYASGLLPDGRLIIEGGEYIAGQPTWTTRGAIYDPVADAWTEVHPPTGWAQIGDASGIVLPSGKFLLSSCCTSQTALFDPRTLTWGDFGIDKLDINDEESWALLPDGSILTVDANNAADPKASERFDPHTGHWIYAGDTPVQISDFNPDPADPSSHEVGPNVLRADGTVLAIGGNGHDAVFDSRTLAWSSAPDMPVEAGAQIDVADGPAALLPNGEVLVLGSPGVFGTPAYIYEYDDAHGFTAAPLTPSCAGGTSYQYAMLLLPTGEVLLTDYSTQPELYTPAPGVVPGIAPDITGIGELGGTLRSGTENAVIELYPGDTYVLEGDRLSGVSQGGFYGDDVQTATNFPLVRVTYAATSHVRYLRTHDHSSRAIGLDTRATTQFDVPADSEIGPAVLEVVVNGIASPGVAVDVK